MTEKEKELAEQLETLQKSMQAQTLKLAEQELKAYGFEGEELDEISKAYVSMSEEGQTAITKAFTKLSEDVKAAKSEKAELEKAADKLPESDLEKEYGAEDDESAEDKQPLSLRQKVEKARQARDSKESK